VYGPVVRALGEPVHRSAVIATAAAVPGVVAVDLDRLYRATAGLQPRLLADPARVTGSSLVGVELLALSDAPFDWLQEMP
jgi:hypothetical protein